jgi:UDP-N-acetylmuramoylalanine-D-glutamate ligase
VLRQASSRLTAPPQRPSLPPGPYLVVGLGRAGFAAARALAAKVGARAVRVWDAANDDVQRERADVLSSIGVDVALGGDGRAALGDARTLVKSPGVPPTIPVVAEALRRGLVLVDELEIGWALVPAPTVAVTGTNGKSTVSALCVQVLAAHGLAPELTGNTEFGPPLSELSDAPPRSVVAEVSSYQSEFARELAVEAAVFTNLTREHLNRHGDLEEYGAAKRRLFVRGEWCVPIASLNVDDPFGRRLAGEIERRGGRAFAYGFSEEADYRIAASRWGLHGGELEVRTPDGPVQLETVLPGAHNAANLTAVLALADGLDLPRERTLEALAGAAAPPGRFEVLDTDAPFDVVVDFAISADAVSNVLRTARTPAAARGGRVLTVLTILGRSTPLIGPEVGAAARELSDHLVLCGSSYRGEPRLVALAELRSGARAARGGTVETIIDRREAIARALSAARLGDVVAILGRGATTREATDARGGFRELDDRQIVRELV